MLRISWLKVAKMCTSLNCCHTMRGATWRPLKGKKPPPCRWETVRPVSCPLIKKMSTHQVQSLFTLHCHALSLRMLYDTVIVSTALKAYYVRSIINDWILSERTLYLYLRWSFLRTCCIPFRHGIQHGWRLLRESGLWLGIPLWISCQPTEGTS